MTHVKSTHIALAESFCSRVEIPVIATVILKMAHTLVIWSERTKSRGLLRTMDAYRLRDIGLTPAEARLESAKPFWRP
jgi:uncharacterized protein YjiS (DUF1127 family)